MKVTMVKKGAQKRGGGGVTTGSAAGRRGPPRTKNVTTTTVTTPTPKQAPSRLATLAQQIRHLLPEVHPTTGGVLEPRADAVRLDTLRRIFTQLCTEHELVLPFRDTSAEPPPRGSSSVIRSRSGGNKAAQQQKLQKSTLQHKWSTFVYDAYQQFVAQLCRRIQHQQRHSSLRCLWGVLAGCPYTRNLRHGSTTPATAAAASFPILNPDLLEQWVLAMTTVPSSSAITASSRSRSLCEDHALRHLLEQELLQPYRDVQYYVLHTIATVATRVYHQQQQQQQEEEQQPQANKTNPAAAESGVVSGDLLLDLVMMIPVPRSVSEDDTRSPTTQNYLFPPPPSSLGSQENVSAAETGHESAESNSDASSDEEDSSDEEEEKSADEEEEKKENAGKEKKKKHATARLDARYPYRSMTLYRRMYRKAWLAVLLLPNLSTSALKKALLFLPTQHVLECIQEPLRFSDFFMQAYRSGSGSGSGSSDNDATIIGVLALEGLFTLITKYGLEYTNFYKQLYTLVTARSMYAKYRVRFFTLVAKSLLYNPMLPAHVVAAFLKRLTRCALSGPIPGTLFVLTLASNLLKKHPECYCLIHRGGNEGVEAAPGQGTTTTTMMTADPEDSAASSTTTMMIQDAFVADEDDPVECGALQSSLWELAVLERHYHPAVATLAKSVGTIEEDKAPMYNVEQDFVSYTYNTLFDEEKKKKNPNYSHNKKRKHVSDSTKDEDGGRTKAITTPLAFKKPTTLFTDEDIFSGLIQMG